MAADEIGTIRDAKETSRQMLVAHTRFAPTAFSAGRGPASRSTMIGRRMGGMGTSSV